MRVLKPRQEPESPAQKLREGVRPVRRFVLSDLSRPLPHLRSTNFIGVREVGVPFERCSCGESMKQLLKQAFLAVRRLGTSWIAKQSLSHLETIRERELAHVIALLPASGRILEIGAGTGWQAIALHRRGYAVCAVDLPASNYSLERVWEITEYDGKILPFDDNAFDIVFSSNVLEHIPHVRDFQNEIQRVLTPDGLAIHVLPSSSWRIWTSLTHVLKCWTLPRAHGEHAKNAWTEIYYFSIRWWTQLFRQTGWVVMTRSSNEQFHSGCSIMDSRLSTNTRCKLSRILGGSCNIFVLKPASRH